MKQLPVAQTLVECAEHIFTTEDDQEVYSLVSNLFMHLLNWRELGEFSPSKHYTAEHCMFYVLLVAMAEEVL